MRLSWVIGGAQGTGIDTAANIFGNAVASAGYYIYGNREYYSNIKGRHSYFSLTISDKRVRSNTQKIDILVSFDAETVFQHFYDVKDILIYNKAVETTKIDAVQSMEPELAERIKDFLTKQGYETTVKGALEYASKNNVTLIPVNYDEIAKKVADEMKVPLSVTERVKNIVGITISYKLLGLDVNYLIEAINSTFKQDLYRKMNELAVKDSYDIVESRYNLKPSSKERRRFWLDGNTAVAIGKIYGGVRFQSYYPITPASDESVYIEAHQDVLMEDPITGDKKKGTIVVVQAEDELAAINMAIGAALTGVRAATATSGPGFSLMVEGLGWAGMNEVPVVITYYIRGGPSTGLPTRTAQSDLIFPIFAGHGEFPKIVLASGDHAEAFKDAIWALNLAEKYQTPVIHLVEKTLANSYSTIPYEELELDKLKAERGKIVESGDISYKRFKFTEDGISPRAFLGKATMYYTGDEHNEEGHISEDVVNRTMMYEKRMKKLEVADKEIPEESRVKIYGDLNSRNLIITWGSPTGVLRDILEESNFDFTLLQIRMFSPFPKNLVSKLMEGRDKIITVEGNYLAQTSLLVKMYTGKDVTNSILKWNGRPFLRDELEEALIKVIKDGEKRVVLNGGI
ncbi:2-oxoacid:ferredoxin oxidoreductase subunit alpha [Sulfurisphaera tokodaii]|uniref:2-oxoacid:ferredoxin oxidoreductase 1, subunit alpha n=2 Tax=Sulfurisphaera tokodaii TaxID=111955 RepID=OFOA1_SULTO|nr:2-oxoacid:ferredoxin oxidoreductase subunit alpha [Sulfurisphaera tokodaii]Q96Y66.1 RecName: Full=2-oxoacid:ferredoxin oxidoreductase 1, subunit alpha; Short=OFOR1 [Sulfurisphaera tokodaii str. 7]5B48_A Chain A, 2-oxoacid--ferredoxin oxidoreductase alpha subunit [Sulfurisphaera tokodaii str. 7]5B48_C Chain C, 2-oxoacid--ferredoxin oxidoreductase alpha subunit [Sulfurisphaera tokodaii str. 7]BAB67411.1 2-oxoacid--ferredoxin oxidoreductase alpha subunit [Sulfurisphaera tokodaii str. 7]HII7512